MNGIVPQFQSSHLTPARLQWVMDVGETTVGEWVKNREIEYFKKGRLIRFSPEAVLEFIGRYRVKARLKAAAPLNIEPGSEAWARLERLIRDQIEHYPRFAFARATPDKEAA